MARKNKLDEWKELEEGNDEEIQDAEFEDEDLRELPRTILDCYTLVECQGVYERDLDKLRTRLERQIALIQSENEQIRAKYEQDAVFSLFFSLQRKGNEVAASLNSFKLNLKSDDKSFERFNILIKLMPELTKTLATMKADYLKLDDESLEEIKKKGIPLIEQQGKKPKKIPANKKSPASGASEEYEL